MSNKPLFSMDEWKKAFGKNMTEEIFTQIEDTGLGLDPDTIQTLYLNFIASFMGAVVYRALLYRPEDEKLSKEELFQLTSKNFQNVKLDMQEAVSAAFTGAMRTYSGKSVDYYCQVKVVPEAINKEPC